MALDSAFPRLTADNHRAASPPTVEYNCIAWAAKDTERWWQPGTHWPIAAPPGEWGIAVLEGALRALGYEPCDTDRLEVGFEKVALFGDALFYTHAARQLPDGTWTSKLGKAEDIEHDTPEDVAGGIYGEVVQYMQRPVGKS